VSYLREKEERSEKRASKKGRANFKRRKENLEGQGDSVEKREEA